MRRSLLRWAATVAVATAVVVIIAACGSSSSSTSASQASSGGGSGTSTSSSSGSSSGGGSSSKAKIAIMLTQPVTSSLGQPAATAASQIKQQFGNQVTVQGSIPQSNVLQTFQGYATHGYSLIIADGAEMQQQAVQAAAQYPQVKFVVVNGNAAKAPNLASATYSWEQSGFLAGLAAGTVTKTHKVSTMSSIKIPPIEGLYYGFQQGVKQVDPSAKTENSYMGNNSADTTLSANLTSAQASAGNDVVFTVATGADPGVFRAAEQHNMLVVGYGVDETPLGPKNILTSTLVDYTGTMVSLVKLFDGGQFAPKVYTYGFKDHAFKLAPIANVPKATAAKIQALAQQAENGKFNIKTLSSNF